MAAQVMPVVCKWRASSGETSRRGLGCALLACALLACQVGDSNSDLGGDDPLADAAAAGAIGADAGGAMAEDAGPPSPDARPTTVRIAVISDLNGSYGSTSYGTAVHAASDRLVALAPDVVLSTGDMVAGQQAGLDYPAMWESFHQAVTDPLAAAGIPLAITPGNHDASGYGAYAGERAEFVSQWATRTPDVVMLDDTHYPLRYSFAVGQVLFVALDDTTVGPLDAEQMAWLEAQLTVHTDYAASIVFGHLPLYPFSEGRETEIIGDPRLESLLVARGVDLFVSGHHHAYYPGQRGPLRLVSVACLGAGPRRLVGDSATSARSILLLEVTGAEIVALDAYGGAGFDQVIGRAGLPSSIGSGASAITRDDLM